MTVFIFDEIDGVSVKFDVRKDVVQLSGVVSSYRISYDDNGNAVISKGDKSLTLANPLDQRLTARNLMIADGKQGKMSYRQYAVEGMPA